jgi:hypothetical protein
MGWLYGWKSREELTVHLLKEPTSYTTLASKRTSEGESVLWAVHEVAVGQNAGERFIVCYLIGHDRRDGTFGYKDMGESSGPCFYSCPLAYLDMVPQPEGAYVQGWRDKVRQFHAAKSERKNRLAALKLGDTLKLREGCKPPEIMVTSLKPLRGTHGGTLYRVTAKHVA